MNSPLNRTKCHSIQHDAEAIKLKPLSQTIYRSRKHTKFIKRQENRERAGSHGKIFNKIAAGRENAARRLLFFQKTHFSAHQQHNAAEAKASAEIFE